VKLYAKLREEHRLSLFDYRAFRIILGNEVIGDWKRLHNEELQ
jgi:hypothetical protein